MLRRQLPLNLGHHPSALSGGSPSSAAFSAGRRSHPGPGLGSGHTATNGACPPPFLPAASPRNLVASSPILAATRQSYPGFGSGRAATNATCHPQVSPASSPWHPLADAASFYYNTFGPRVLPSFQMGRLPAMPLDSASAITDPREMMNFPFYQHSFMVSFWLIFENDNLDFFVHKLSSIRVATPLSGMKTTAYSIRFATHFPQCRLFLSSFVQKTFVLPTYLYLSSLKFVSLYNLNCVTFAFNKIHPGCLPP